MEKQFGGTARLKTISHDVNDTAARMRRSLKEVVAGGEAIEINYRLPTVAINHSDGAEYFFQGEEADNLIEEARNSPLHEYCSVENILLWQSAGW